jgi:hypothetical protein
VSQLFGPTMSRPTKQQEPSKKIDVGQACGSKDGELDGFALALLCSVQGNKVVLWLIECGTGAFWGVDMGPFTLENPTSQLDAASAGEKGGGCFHHTFRPYRTVL